MKDNQDSRIEEILDILRCPITHSPLKLENGELVSTVGGLRYPIQEGIPILLPTSAKLPDGIASLDDFKQIFATQS